MPRKSLPSRKSAHQRKQKGGRSPNLGFTQTFDILPQSIQRIVQYGISTVKPEKIILFGSRARGDHAGVSDFDIAFCGKISFDAWVRFKTDVEEKPFSLYETDLVHFEKMSVAYQRSIEEDGVLLYGL